MSTTIVRAVRGDVEAGTDRGRDRLRDERRRAGAGGADGLLDGLALDVGRAAGHAGDEARREARPDGERLVDRIGQTRASAARKSEIVPRRSGRTTRIFRGARPSISLAAWPIAMMRSSSML